MIGVLYKVNSKLTKTGCTHECELPDYLGGEEFPGEEKCSTELPPSHSTLFLCVTWEGDTGLHVQYQIRMLVSEV